MQRIHGGLFHFVQRQRARRLRLGHRQLHLYSAVLLSGNPAVGCAHAHRQDEGPMKMVKRSERGNTMVEFALAFMVFFVVLYGIMEFGRVVASYNILSGAAREGARYAIVHGSSSGSAASSTDIQTIVRNWSVGLESSSVAVTTTWTPGNAPG